MHEPSPPSSKMAGVWVHWQFELWCPFFILTPTVSYIYVDFLLIPTHGGLWVLCRINVSNLPGHDVTDSYQHLHGC